MLFGRDNGHYPTFDLFKAYYAIVDNYTKEIQYISDEIYVTDKYNLLVEDRNKDGISELYISYFKDGKFRKGLWKDSDNVMGVRAQQKEKTRRSLVEAAFSQLSAERSFASLSLREVAREAGIAPTSF